MFRGVLAILYGYVSGGLLFSKWLPKMIKGIDVTKDSIDHNPGVANVMKYAGVKIGILCLICDLLKGIVPIYVIIKTGLLKSKLFSLMLVSPIIGHSYSIFNQFKGGKSIAVSFGVLIGLTFFNYWPLVLLACLYIIGSLIKINPHTKRTRITYICFMLANFLLYARKLEDISILLGMCFISLVIIHKNSIQVQNREEIKSNNC